MLFMKDKKKKKRNRQYFMINIDVISRLIPHKDDIFNGSTPWEVRCVFHSKVEPTF